MCKLEELADLIFEHIEERDDAEGFVEKLHEVFSPDKLLMKIVDNPEGREEGEHHDWSIVVL